MRTKDLVQLRKGAEDDAGGRHGAHALSTSACNEAGHAAVPRCCQVCGGGWVGCHPEFRDEAIWADYVEEAFWPEGPAECQDDLNMQHCGSGNTVWQ